jgi:hypothetical protein
MKNPPPIYRGLFVVSIGFLLVSVLFSATKIPGAGLFSVIGGVVSLTFYIIFNRVSGAKLRSNYAKHATIFSLVLGIVLKSFEVGIGTYLFLVAFVCFLVWFAWSVLEQLPPSSND